MVTPRVGSLGVLSATGNMLYRDANGNIDEIDTAGANDGDILIRVAGLPTWQPPGSLMDVFMSQDANDAIFTTINAVQVAGADLRSGYPIVTFDPDTEEGIMFQMRMPTDYMGGNLNLNLYWTSTATVGDAVLTGAFERLEVTDNVDVPNFAAPQSVTQTSPAGSGEIVLSTIPFTNAQADALAENDPFRLFVTRDATNVADDMAADLQFLFLTITEAP